jgi:hypothetical protein
MVLFEAMLTSNPVAELITRELKAVNCSTKQDGKKKNLGRNKKE